MIRPISTSMAVREEVMVTALTCEADKNFGSSTDFALQRSASWLEVVDISPERLHVVLVPVLRFWMKACNARDMF